MTSEIITWSERLIGFAIVLQSVELLLVRNNFYENGIWSWFDLRNDYPEFFQVFLSLVLSRRSFVGLLIVQAIFAVLLMAFPDGALAAELLIFLAIVTLLESWRYRGTYNGGSDFMTMVVLIGLTGARIFSQWEKYFIAYIAVQVCLSYFISGLVKLKKKNWITGEAFQSLSRSQSYSIPSRARKLMSRAGFARCASLLLIIYEVSFPFALVNTDFCRVYIVIAVMFHLAMVYVFGLNRFLWAWFSAYPALFYWSNRG
jgi:hypothetical protein